MVSSLSKNRPHSLYLAHTRWKTPGGGTTLFSLACFKKELIFPHTTLNAKENKENSSAATIFPTIFLFGWLFANDGENSFRVNIFT
jgi:hypothetical protein